MGSMSVKTLLARMGLGDTVQELMLDFDTTSWGQVQKRLAPNIVKLRTVAIDGKVSKTRHGYHIRIRLGHYVFTPKQINALQCVMGDDPKRVRLNLSRIERGERHFNRLWQMKFGLDGEIRGQEIDAPGETKSLKLMLFPTDTVFVRHRNESANNP
jgi:hypothetical protein